MLTGNDVERTRRCSRSSLIADGEQNSVSSGARPTGGFKRDVQVVETLGLYLAASERFRQTHLRQSVGQHEVWLMDEPTSALDRRDAEVADRKVIDATST